MISCFADGLCWFVLSSKWYIVFSRYKYPLQKVSIQRNEKSFYIRPNNNNRFNFILFALYIIPALNSIDDIFTTFKICWAIEHDFLVLPFHHARYILLYETTIWNSETLNRECRSYCAQERGRKCAQPPTTLPSVLSRLVYELENIKASNRI